MSRSSLQHVRLREDLRKLPADLSQLDAGAATGRVLGHGQTQGTGVAPRGAVPEDVRADTEPRPLESFRRLPGPRFSRGDRVEDADHRGIASERQQSVARRERS